MQYQAAWLYVRKTGHGAKKILGFHTEQHQSGSFVNPNNFDEINPDSPAIFKHFYAPFVAFHTTNFRLALSAIPRTRHSLQPNAIYNQQTCRQQPNTYTLAKMHFACAGHQVQEFSYLVFPCIRNSSPTQIPYSISEEKFNLPCQSSHRSY